MKKYYLPASTAAILNQQSQSQHPGLLLDKYVPAEVINKEEAEDRRKDTRTIWLRDVQKNYHLDPELAGAAYQRWYSYTSALHASRFEAQVDWRLIVGLGGNSVLETDLTLHHLYGLPIIPGSALKGLTRTYAAIEDEEVFMRDSDGQPKPSTAVETDHEKIQRIFGTQENAGTVIFFDAFPEKGQARLVLDIMNPHYPDYYQKDAAPTNDQNPIPITFLAIHRTTYVFALALRQEGSENHKDDLPTAKIWLKKALAEYGVGGKTSAGYGYFKELRDQKSSTNQALQEALPQAMPSEPEHKPYERPRMPHFHIGQDVKGAVVPPTSELHQLAPEATAFLRYESFPLKEVLIIVCTEEAQEWKPGDVRNCSFHHEEVQNSCTILVCQPKIGKKKKKDKKRTSL